MPITWLDKIDGFDLGDPQKNVNASDMNQIKTEHNSLEVEVDGKVSSSSFVDGETPSGTINSSNVTFNLSFAPVVGSVKIFKNGQRLTVGTSYTISGSTITFLTAPDTGDDLKADYRK